MIGQLLQFIPFFIIDLNTKLFDKYFLIRKNDNQDESLCKTRGCTWNPPESDLDAPSCFYPPSYGYKAVSQPIATTHGERVYLQKIGI